MRRIPLLSQIIAINALLVMATVLVATTATNLDFRVASDREQFLILFGGVLGILLANAMLLRRRLEPLDQLISTMEKADLTAATVDTPVAHLESEEVARLHGAFVRMLERLKSERRQGARAVLRAQEEERRRIAQDLHDEVNQALTAIALRLEALRQSAPPELDAELRETRRLAGQAMDELLQLARQLRPTTLDDMGLIPALRTQVRDFSDQTGIHADFRPRGDVPPLSDDQQLVIYRVTQESLSNVAQHANARHVMVELSFVGRTVLRISDDGRGVAATTGGTGSRNGGLGLSGMQERALLVGGQLDVHSVEGQGTTVTLTM
jgi:two-component system, NarL family, sensor histidine kinase UhpB